jgi:hypothetical protein
MPVYRFRTLEDARRALWLKPGDPRLERITEWVWALAAELMGPHPPPRGLKKFRTLEEANADRKHWEAERSRSLRKSLPSEPVRPQV